MKHTRNKIRDKKMKVQGFPELENFISPPPKPVPKITA
jgi:hypothetical protein